MAINTFTFGGITSSTYGIYVSGEGLFNAPKRDAEVVQIPGRDGDYILDKGSFENIEVTYRVFNQEKDLSDFRTKLANLRSALCSKTGYQRLTDTFHPNEYRMAAFIDGIEINPIKYNTASEFEIKFNCKPQRYLTSGETAVAVASGGKVTNPTLFDAKPQLQVYGYGNIDMGGAEISIANVPLGNIQIGLGGQSNYGLPSITNIVSDLLNPGDSFTISGANITVKYSPTSSRYEISNISLGTTTDCSTSLPYLNQVKVQPDDVTFVKGTSSTETYSAEYTVTVFNMTNNTSATTTVTFSGTVAYDGIMTITFSATITSVSSTKYQSTVTVPEIYGDSTKSALGNPMYLDLDIGEAYKIENGSAVSVNDAVQLPAELPVLPPGDTTFTYDNTITSFKVLPRFWKV